jgi:Xaa-Pro aminopeptidase
MTPTTTPATTSGPVGPDLFGTPNLGTGLLEHRDRVDFTALRKARFARVLAGMDERGIDACFFGREANARYASGVRRLWTAQSRPFVPACLVVGGPRPIVDLLAFSASYEDIPEEVGPDHFFPVTWNPVNMIERFRAIPGVLDARRIGFDNLSPLFEGMLRQALPDAEFVGVEDMMRGLRRVKLPDEITCLRTAAAIAESSLYAAVGELRPGVTEHHLRAAFFDRMCELGTSQFAQQGTFAVLDPGKPFRWTTSDRVVEEGDAVAFGGGALWAGYEGSLARTWVCGNAAPSAEQRAAYARWRAVMDAVVGECRPGRTGADLRSAFERAGAGHPEMTIAYAVGLGHEGPIAGLGMSPELERAQSLEPGMVLAVRHHENTTAAACFGEDMLLVTAAGPEPLTTLGAGPLAAGA